MMDSNDLAIPIAFTLLSMLLCLVLIGTKWKWWQKLALILIVPSFGFAVWDSIGSFKGWPSASEASPRSLVYQVLIREPDPSRGDPGEIFLWLMPYDEKVKLPLNPLEYVSPGGEPRGYKMPYTRQRHEALEGAKELLRRGRPTVLDLRKREKGSERMLGGGGGTVRGMEGDPDRNDFRVYELPPPHPPEKYPE